MLTLFLRGGHFLGVTVVQVSGPCLDESDNITCVFDGQETEGVFVSTTVALCLSPPLMTTGGYHSNWLCAVLVEVSDLREMQNSSHVSTELYIPYLLIIESLHISKCSILHDGTARIDPCVVLHLQCHLMKDLGFNWMHPVCCSCLNCTRNYLAMVTGESGSILGVDLYTRWLLGLLLQQWIRHFAILASHLSNAGQVGVILSSLMYGCTHRVKLVGLQRKTYWSSYLFLHVHRLLLHTLLEGLEYC